MDPHPPPRLTPHPFPLLLPLLLPLGHLLLGSHTGGLTLLDLSTGDCTSPSTPSSLPRVQSSPVLAVGLHPPTSQLFVATADCQLHRYAFPSLTLLSSMPTPSPVTLLPSLTPLPTLLPLALGPSLALLDLSPPSPSSFALHRRFASTSSDLCSVAVSEDGQLYATASNDRYVQLWSAGVDVSEKKKGKAIKPLATLTLQSPATHVALHQVDGGYHVAVVEEHHTVHVFAYPNPASSSSASSSSLSPLTPITSLRLPSPSSSSSSSSPSPSLIAHLRQGQQAERHNQRAEGKRKKGMGATPMRASTAVDGGEGGQEGGVMQVEFAGEEGEVLIVRGDRERVAFDRVRYLEEGEGGKGRGEVVLEKRVMTIQAQHEPATQRRKRSHEVTILPTSAAPLTPSTTSPPLPPSTKKQKLPPTSLPPPSSSSSSPTTVASALPLLQRTLAERLAEMEKKTGPYAGDARAKEPGGGKGGDDVVVPRAGSLQSVLTQALHTGDDALFEYCLSLSLSMGGGGGGGGMMVGGGGVGGGEGPPALRQTLQRLPSAYLLPLLTKLTSLLHARPSRALPLLTWMHALLLTHATTLLTLPPHVLHPLFSRLMGLLDSRVKGYKQMCRLQGKLQLIIQQVEGRRGGGGGGGAGLVGEGEGERAGGKGVGKGPKMVYLEGRGLVANAEAEDEEAEGSGGEGEAKEREKGVGKKRRRRRGGLAASAPPRPTVAAPTDEEEEGGEGEDEDDVMGGLNGSAALELEEESDDDDDE